MPKEKLEPAQSAKILIAHLVKWMLTHAMPVKKDFTPKMIIHVKLAQPTVSHAN